MPVEGITGDSWAQFLKITAQARSRNPEMTPPSAGIKAQTRAMRTPLPAVHSGAYSTVAVSGQAVVKPKILGNRFDVYA